MTEQEAIIATVKRWSDIVDGVSTIDESDCDLCDNFACEDCPCIIALGAHCRGRPFYRCPEAKHFPITPEENLIAACMIAAVYGIEVR